MTVSKLIAYVKDRYGAEPEHLWAKFPNNFVFRHPGNKKWFAAVVDPPRNKIGLSGEGTVDMLDVKCGPLLSGSYIGKPGILPAYHMNKTHWLGVLLGDEGDPAKGDYLRPAADGSAEDETIKELLELSYDLTKERQQHG